MIIDKPVRMTRHFRERMKMFGVKLWELFYMIPMAMDEKPPDQEAKRYQDPNVRHIRYGTYIFAYTTTRDKFDESLGEVYLFLSVYNQELDLGYKVIGGRQ